MICTERSAPLSLENEVPDSLPTSHFVALKQPFSTQQAQCVQTLACAALQAFRWSLQAPTSLTILFFSQTLAFSFCCFFSVLAFFSLSLEHLEGTIYLFLLSYQATIGPRSLADDDKFYELGRRGALFQPSTVLCSLSPFIFCIHSFLLMDW